MSWRHSFLPLRHCLGGLHDRLVPNLLYLAPALHLRPVILVPCITCVVRLVHVVREAAGAILPRRTFRSTCGLGRVGVRHSFPGSMSESSLE